MRWANINQTKNKKLSKVIDIDKDFNFLCILVLHKYFCNPILYDDGKETSLMSREDILVRIHF